MAGVSLSEVEAHYSDLQTGDLKKSAWQQFRSNCFQMKMLIWWTLLGVGFGLVLGVSLYSSRPSALAIELIGYPGELLIRALQELVLPLMVFALMSGVFNLRHSASGTGRIIRWSLLYYLLSMLLAVALGIALVYTIQPGRSSPFNGNNSVGSCGNSNAATLDSAHASKSAVDSLLNIGRDLIPTNIVAAAALPNYLGIITFAIIFASALNSFGERAEPLIRILELCNDVFMKIIYVAIALTPVGVASLLASTILKSCSLVELIKALALYVSTVVLGFCVHTFVVLPTTIFLLSQQNPFKVFRQFMPALLLGIGTSSSAATMPVTMQCGEEYGCASSIVRFVVPMGTNINRDGAALYEAVSVIFICQAHGLTLSVGSLVVVALTATLAAIGSASVPNSALVSMITVLQALGLQEYIPDVAVLYSVDWLLGMVRTTVNVWGDACACVIVDTWATRYAKKHDRLPITADVETALKRILSLKDVIGLLLVDADGNILRSTIPEEDALNYAIEIPALAVMCRSAVRELEPKNDLSMIRMKSRKHELMVVVDEKFTLMVIQEYPGHWVEPPPPPPPPKDSDDDDDSDL